MDPAPGIECAYCGGRHPTAAQVRACWATHGSPAPVADASEPAPAPSPRPGPAPVGDEREPAVWSGPEALGRNLLLVGEGPGRPPAPWHDAEVVDVAPALAGGAATDRLADHLLGAALGRRRLVFLAPQRPEEAPRAVEGREPWRLSPDFRFGADVVGHLVAAHAVELGPGGGARFRLAERAVALGARPLGGDEGDVILPGGEAAFCDGGPVRLPGGPVAGWGPARLVHRIALEHGSLAPLGPVGALGPTAATALAPDQVRAVTHPGGAARVIAPAGSGKTRVLTERARHLLGVWNVPAGALCLVAYNVRAAEEMRARTTDRPDLQIRTLNSLALAIVNGTPPFAPRPERRATIDEPEVRDLLGTLVSLPRRANTDPAAAWIEALSSVRLGLRDPADVEEEYGGDVDGLAEVFDRWRALLAERRVLDFDEQVYGAVEVLLTDPVARAAAQRACRLLLVDEFQDLTPAHVLLLRLAAGPDGAVFGVGDDDQTIYGYAGASPDWLIGFASLFPGAAEHALEVNYRCPPAVVAAADRLLQRNRRRVPKQIRPAPGRAPAEGELEVLAPGVGGDDEVDDGAAVVDQTVQRVTRLVAAGAAPTDVAVLARVNAGLVAVQVALGARGVPVRTVLDEAWLRRTGVAAALAWLRIAVEPDRIQPADLRVALRRPPRGIAPRVVDWTAEQGSAAGLRRLAARLTGRDGPKVAVLADDVGRLAAAVRAGASSGELLALVRDDLGLDRAMASLEGARRRLDRSAQTDDLEALVALARLHPAVGSFEAWLRERLREPSVRDGVVLATVHSVKGREWPHVVVHHATAGVMPHRLAADDEEERRVFHVALTRGMRSVAVSAGRPPSPFVAELVRDPGADPPRPPRLPATGRAGPGGPGGPGGGSGPRLDSPAQQHVAARLREWRRDLAATEKRPAYTVLHDTTLDAVAAALPASAAELRSIKGIGPAKLDRYGEAILAIVAEAAE